jgi:hypothetical protein
MTRGILTLIVAALLALALVGAQGSAAATQRKSPITQGYGNPVVAQTLAAQKTVSKPPSATSPLSTTGRQSTLPFTGIDLALLSSGGAGLLLLGASLRRLGRQKA